MKKIVAYNVISAISEDDLTKLVNHIMAESNWQPLGGVSTTHSAVSGMKFTQAMVRYRGGLTEDSDLIGDF